MSEIKYPKVYIIDGTDGCGKKTITSKIVSILENDGHKVGLIEPPFYESPTGQIIRDYLFNGYGDITDRRIASQLYAVDRNMWMKDHFKEYFLSNRYDVIIYNRSWISNLIHQTTIKAQTLQDTTEMGLYIDFFRYRIYLSDIAQFFYELDKISDAETIIRIRDKGIPRRISMPSIGNAWTVKQILGFITSDHSEFTDAEIISALRDAYFKARVKMIYDSMLIDYLEEIDTWRLPEEVGKVPFTSLIAATPIILTPQCSNLDIKVIDQNLNKRYDGDESKKDRNEINMRYQAAVVENIHYLNELIRTLCLRRNINKAMVNNIYGANGSIRTTLEMADVLKMDAKQSLDTDTSTTEFRYHVMHPFQFHIVHITDDNCKLRSIDQIMDDIQDLWPI